MGWLSGSTFRDAPPEVELANLTRLAGARARPRAAGRNWPPQPASRPNLDLPPLAPALTQPHLPDPRRLLPEDRLPHLLLQTPTMASSREEILNDGGQSTPSSTPSRANLLLLSPPRRRRSSTTDGRLTSRLHTLPRLAPLAGLRTDFRRPHELRHFSLSIPTSSSAAHGADGFATCSHGLTVVTSAVHGPKEARNRGGTLFDRAVINVDVSVGSWAGNERRKRGRSDK